MAISDWSTTPGSNGSSDASINFAEGQAPSTVNDSARSLMARVRHWFNWFGATTTSGGASNAYTLTSGESLSAYVAGMRFAWSPNADSTGAVTINVDTIGAKKVYMPDGSQANTGDLDADSIYDLIYDTALDSSAGGFKIVGFPDAVTSGALLAANNLSDLANATTARTNLGVAIGSNVQAYDAGLADIAGLAVTDGNFIVANGTNWIVESGATARTSLGLGSLATLSSVNNGNWSGTDLAVANGGTGASDAATARTNLGAYGSGDNVSFGTLEATGTLYADPNGVGSQGYTSVAQIQANGSGNSGILIHSGTTSSGYITFGDGAVAGRLQYDHSSNSLIISTNASEAMRIDSSGNVGIGTTSPDANLDIESASGGTLRLGSSDTTIAATEKAGVLEFYSADVSAGVVVGEVSSVAIDAGTKFGLAFSTRTTSGSVTEQVRITDTGNVGIGISSPTFTSGYSGLHISDAASELHLTNTSNGTTATDGLAIQVNSSGIARIIQKEAQNLEFHTNNTQRMVIDSSGNVLVGKTSQTNVSAKLDVASFNVGDGTVDLEVLASSSIGFGIVGTNTAHDLVFRTNNSEIMRLDQSSGNVGIGTTSPGALLDVNGEMRARAETNTTVTGTLVEATHLKGAINELSGNVTVPTTTAGCNGVLCCDGFARTITRGTGLTMYVNGSNVASATLAARGVASVLFTTASVCYVSGDVS